MTKTRLGGIMTREKKKKVAKVLRKLILTFLGMPPEKYDQGSYCGTAMCIAGHLACQVSPAYRYEVERGRYSISGTTKLAARALGVGVDETGYGYEAALGDLFWVVWQKNPLTGEDTPFRPFLPIHAVVKLKQWADERGIKL